MNTSKLRKFRPFFYWLLASSLIYFFMFFSSFSLTFLQEWRAEGEDFFSEPIRLSSSNLNICGDKLQQNTLYMLPKYDLWLNYHAQLKCLLPDGRYIDIRGATRDKSLPASANQYENVYQTDWHEILNGNVAPGTCHWKTNVDFLTKTGRFKTAEWSGNDFEIQCKK